MNTKLNLTRTLGFELEGFVSNAEDLEIRHTEVGWDSSLEDGDGDAIEARTDPINDLNLLQETFYDLKLEQFNVNSSCGLHIHVDISDYTVEDRAKLLRFGTGIELLMFGLMSPTRYYGMNYENNGSTSSVNEFCVKIHKSWRKMFRSSFITQPIPFDRFEDLYSLTNYVNNETNATCWNGKYHWLNANVNRFPTVEFRIFHATESLEEVQKFGMLAYHIVETAKNSSIEQIQFIIKSILQSASLEEMYSKLFDSIGLDEEFRTPITNGELTDYIYDKYCVPNQAEVVAVEAI